MKIVRGLVLFMVICIMTNVFIPVTSAFDSDEYARKCIQGTWYSDNNDPIVITSETINRVPYIVQGTYYNASHKNYDVYCKVEGEDNAYGFTITSDGVYNLETRRYKIRALEPATIVKYTSYKK